MDKQDKSEIISLRKISHHDKRNHWLFLIRSRNCWYMAVHAHQAAITYKRVHNLLIANHIITKLYEKLNKIKDYKKASALLKRAFKLSSLFQSLFIINIFGMNKIYPTYVSVLIKRYNIKGNCTYSLNENSELKNVKIEVRIAPSFDLFGHFLSDADENFYHFQLHRKYKRMLKAKA